MMMQSAYKQFDQSRVHPDKNRVLATTQIKTEIEIKTETQIKIEIEIKTETQIKTEIEIEVNG